MAKQLSGKETAAVLHERLRIKAEKLKAQGSIPKLAVVRCGEKASDISYERGIMTRAKEIGVEVERFLLPEDCTREELAAVIEEINGNDGIHGCLLFRPLPETLRAYQRELCNMLSAEKDVDCMTELSNAGVFMGEPLGFAPCTAQACMEILEHYKIACEGKNAVVIGRSLVVGRPVAMLLLQRNATVTVCHTKTKGLAEIARSADILISAAGAAGSLTKEFVRQGQIVVDVSVNWEENKRNARGEPGALTGDAVYDEVEPIVEAITPVPGGVGAVTTSVLLSHVIEAAERAQSV